MLKSLNFIWEQEWQIHTVQITKPVMLPNLSKASELYQPPHKTPSFSHQQDQLGVQAGYCLSLAHTEHGPAQRAWSLQVSILSITFHGGKPPILPSGKRRRPASWSRTLELEPQPWRPVIGWPMPFNSSGMSTYILWVTKIWSSRTRKERPEKERLTHRTISLLRF